MEAIILTIGNIDGPSVVRFLILLPIVVAIIVGTTIFAQWIRTKLVWSVPGRFLVRVGLTKANGTIDDLRQGKLYLVKTSFVDCMGANFQTGEMLTYRWQEYSDRVGPVIHFDERTINLSEEENAEILEKIWAFIEPVNC